MRENTNTPAPAETTKGGLLACPFCGEERVELIADESHSYVLCDGCLAESPAGTTSDAIAAWNRRSAPTATIANTAMGTRGEGRHDVLRRMVADYTARTDAFGRAYVLDCIGGYVVKHVESLLAASAPAPSVDVDKIASEVIRAVECRLTAPLALVRAAIAAILNRHLSGERICPKCGIRVDPHQCRQSEGF